MIRIEYDIGIYSFTLQWLLESKRINRIDKFRALQSRRDGYINNMKRRLNYNKHTMGTE